MFVIWYGPSLRSARSLVHQTASARSSCLLQSGRRHRPRAAYIWARVVPACADCIAWGVRFLRARLDSGKRHAQKTTMLVYKRWITWWWTGSLSLCPRDGCGFRCRFLCGTEICKLNSNRVARAFFPTRGWAVVLLRILKQHARFFLRLNVLPLMMLRGDSVELFGLFGERDTKCSNSSFGVFWTADQNRKESNPKAGRAEILESTFESVYFFVVVVAFRGRVFWERPVRSGVVFLFSLARNCFPLTAMEGTITGIWREWWKKIGAHFKIVGFSGVHYFDAIWKQFGFKF